MVSFSQYERNDPHFVRDLANSNSVVVRVAKWLRRQAFDVTVREIRVRPSVSEMAEYADDGDLTVNGRRAEVKQRRLRFTGRDDFPYEWIIVDAAHIWDRADEKPYFYFITNQDLTAFLIVYGTTARHWRRTERFDRFKKRWRDFYECPKRLAIWGTMK